MRYTSVGNAQPFTLFGLVAKCVIGITAMTRQLLSLFILSDQLTFIASRILLT